LNVRSEPVFEMKVRRLLLGFALERLNDRAGMVALQPQAGNLS